MKKISKKKNLQRRKFFKILTTGGVVASMAPFSLSATGVKQDNQEEKPETNPVSQGYSACSPGYRDLFPGAGRKQCPDFIRGET